MKQEHYDYIASKVEHNQIKLDRYLKKGLTSKRYRWDLLYGAKLSHWICENVYDYLDDSHIDTAVRAITGTK